MEQKEFDNRFEEAKGILDEALEKSLACFPEEEWDKARLKLANYVVGYMGVRFGLTI